MPKRGVFTKRQVVCSSCFHKWYVDARAVGSDRCPKCAEVTRLKGAAAMADAGPSVDKRLRFSAENK